MVFICVVQIFLQEMVKANIKNVLSEKRLMTENSH